MALATKEQMKSLGKKAHQTRDHSRDSMKKSARRSQRSLRKGIRPIQSLSVELDKIIIDDK